MTSMLLHPIQASLLTFKHVIGIMDSKEKDLISQATFYVNMMRAQETATFVVDDLTKIADKKIEHDPQKEEFLLEKKIWNQKRKKAFLKSYLGELKILLPLKKKQLAS